MGVRVWMGVGVRVGVGVEALQLAPPALTEACARHAPLWLADGAACGDSKQIGHVCVRRYELLVSSALPLFSSSASAHCCSPWTSPPSSLLILWTHPTLSLGD